MNILTKMTLRTRIYSILVLSMLLFAGILLLSRRTNEAISQTAEQSLAENLMTKEKEKLQVATHSVTTTLAKIAAYNQSPEAIEKALSDAIDTIRYEADQSGYFTLVTGTTLINVPIKKSMNGQNLKDAVDSDGVKYIAELFEKSQNGGGYVQYNIDKPGQGIKPKLSYAEAIPETDFWLLTGVYLDNIAVQEALLATQIADNTIRHKTLLYALSGGLFFFVLVPLGIAISQSILKPIIISSDSLDNGADQIIRASTEINKASNILASGASQQAAAIEETAASLNEISTLTDQNLHHVSQANQNMSEANTAITQVHSAIGALAQSMDEITNSSNETQKIIKTIDEIAFQTNLLALNAAVEAARAGEAGAGFAVVADEVRALAIRSAEAAKSTATLIENSVNQIHQGSSQMETANNSFDSMMGKTAEVSMILEKIDEVSHQQSQGIRQINKAADEMNDVVQHNAAQAEECAAAANEMDSQSKCLGDIAQTLRQVVEGGYKKKATSSPSNAHPSFDMAASPNTSAAYNRIEDKELVFN